MNTDFTYLGLLHLTVLLSIPVGAVTATLLARSYRTAGMLVCFVLALLLATGELAYYGYLYFYDPPATPDGLPLQLCNVALWVTVAALLTQRRAVMEVAFYLGMFGPPLGLLAPQLWAPAFSFPTLQFFAGHAGVVVSVLFLVLSGRCLPTLHGAFRSFFALNAIGVFLGSLNAVLGTNYMFLRQAPTEPWLFTVVGEWPYHLAAGEVIAAAVLVSLALIVGRCQRAPERTVELDGFSGGLRPGEAARSLVADAGQPLAPGGTQQQVLQCAPDRKWRVRINQNAGVARNLG